MPDQLGSGLQNRVDGCNSRSGLQNMKIPPKPKTFYVLDNDQNKRIMEKLNKLAAKDLHDDELLKLLYSQLETDWGTPLEKFIDELLKK